MLLQGNYLNTFHVVRDTFLSFQQKVVTKWYEMVTFYIHPTAKDERLLSALLSFPLYCAKF